MTNLVSCCEFKEPIRGVERGLYRAVDLVADDLAASKNLHVSCFKVDVYKDGDQLLAQRIHVIEIGKRAGKTVGGRFLHGLQSGRSSRFQGASSLCAVFSIGMKNELAQRKRHTHAALIPLHVDFRAIKSEALKA